MRKQDLKTGMLFKCRNGKIYLIINGIGICERGYNSIESYKDDLTYSAANFTIDAVSEILPDCKLSPRYWNNETLDMYLLWKRNKEVVMTIEEIEEKLGITNLKIKK